VPAISHYASHEQLAAVAFSYASHYLVMPAGL